MAVPPPDNLLAEHAACTETLAGLYEDLAHLLNDRLVVHREVWLGNPDMSATARLKQCDVAGCDIEREINRVRGEIAGAERHLDHLAWAMRLTRWANGEPGGSHGEH